MKVSSSEAAILSVLEKGRGSLTDPELGNLLKQDGINTTSDERYDYVEALKNKGLVHVKLVRAFNGRSFAGLRITGEGRTILKHLT